MRKIRMVRKMLKMKTKYLCRCFKQFTDFLKINYGEYISCYKQLCGQRFKCTSESWERNAIQNKYTGCSEAHPQPCRSSGIQSPASHCSDADLSPGRITWDLCWTERHWRRFSPSNQVFLPIINSTNSFTVIPIYLSSSAGAIGQQTITAIVHLVSFQPQKHKEKDSPAEIHKRKY